jgi:hypothetical protein
MGFSDITGESVNRAVDEFDDRGREAFLRRYGFGHARNYYLVVAGRYYDSKAIVGAAHGYARPDLGPLRSVDFSGGHATVEALLTRLGFRVEVLDQDVSANQQPHATAPWHLRPGDKIARAVLHDRYGGTREGGIAPSRRSPNILIFTDALVGAEHGYFDHWQGSTLHYTGEGQAGNQQMTRGNKAIKNHIEDGRTLRLFEGIAGEVVYVGEFKLGATDPYYEDSAPPSGGGPLRSVIVFRLDPVGEFFHSGKKRNPRQLFPSLSAPYRPVNEEASVGAGTPVFVDPDVVDRGNRAHRSLQNALAAHVSSLGFTPISPELGDPAFDVGWWDEDTFCVAEVKSLTAVNETGHLRLGLGQLLDYDDAIRRAGKRTRAVLAVEREPSDHRWKELCANHGVILTWPPSWESL